MRYNPPKNLKLSEMAQIDVGRLTEPEALAILEGIRWPEGIKCPHCGSSNVARIQGKADSVREGLNRCHDCKGHFTVMVGTVMEDSHLAYRQWVQAFYSMCAHKKGVSALQLQRNLGLGSYRSAWYLAHRIRLAMMQDPLASKLQGVVEVDETYVGGKPRKGDGKEHKRGRGTKKVPVMVLVERDGKSVSHPVKRVNAQTLKAVIRENVDKSSTIMTDEWKAYTGIGKHFYGGHGVINHGIGQYVNGPINTNTAESYFALLKRGVNGTFHHVSEKHLGRYCDEFSFRWNYRKTNDGERATEAIKGMSGKRLLYKDKMPKA
jgi:transposase-like protein